MLSFKEYGSHKPPFNLWCAIRSKKILKDQLELLMTERFRHQKLFVQKSFSCSFLPIRSIFKIIRDNYDICQSSFIVFNCLLFYINLMKKKQNGKIAESLQWSVLFQENENQFVHKTNFLRRWVKIWHDDQKQRFQPQLNLKSILIQYATYIEDSNNKAGLEGHLYINSITYDQELKKVKTEKQVYLGYDFFDLKNWKINFSHQFIRQLYDLSFDVVQHVFTLVYIYAQGYLPFYGMDDICLRPVQSSSQQKYYETSVEVGEERYCLLLSIGVQKVPIFSFKSNSLQSFEFQSFITCQLILKEEYASMGALTKTLDQIQISNEYNPKLDFLKNELVILQEKINPKLNYYETKINKQVSDMIFKTYPYSYKDLLVDKFSLQNFDFMLKRHKMHQNKEIFLQNFLENQQLSVNQQNINLLQREIQKHEFLQFQHAARIIEILQQIPNFKYRITNQQRQVLSKSGNLIVVGRSGTGKTTCAMLRLYGIEYITKKRQINRRLSQSRSQVKQCQMSIFEQLQLSKNMFLTFSPILIEEIKNQYADMLYQIKEKHVQKCQKCKSTFIKKQIRKEEDDPIDKMKRQLEEQEKRVISLNSLNKNDYPAFFTIQNFIRMIDKTIQRPFYDHQLERKDKKSVLATTVKSYINKYSYTAERIEKQSTIYAVYVDFSYFNNHVWAKIPKEFTKASKDFPMVTPAVVWSQILSIIKGSVKSYTCPDGSISLKMYLEEPRNIFQNYQKEMITNIKIKIYSIFKVYQSWCKQEDAYDLMDVVNHLLQQTQFYGYTGPKMNYVFIDEVQDLTTATVFLLSKLVINNIFYCGDTAQAITKGVDFRFQDLKFIFSKQHCKNAIKMSPPEDLIHLTVNFRSHNRILQLANSIISSIQEIFPNTIGKIKKKEQSDLFGPKPYIILKRTDQLFDLLCGPKQISLKSAQNLVKDNQIKKKLQNPKKIIAKKEVIQEQIRQNNNINLNDMDKQIGEDENVCNQQQADQYQESKEDEIESEEISEEQQKQYRKFNSEQIIIVRNMEQAKKLPPTLKEGIVLTPERAKGLEYDQIILYNFFSSSPCFQKWSILDYFYVEQSYQQEQKFQLELSRRNQEQTGVQQQINLLVKQLLEYNFDLKKYKVRTIKKKPSFQQLNLNLYYELVTQLKMLYTIITRARSVFVIYDSQIPKGLVRLWEKMDLTVQINDKNLASNRKDIEVYTKRERHVKYLNEDELWSKQGATMLHRKEYENAKKCFKRINRFDIVQRIQAMQLEMKAEDQMHRLDSQYKKLNGLGRQDKKIKKIKLDRKKKQILAIYIETAKIFQKYKRYQEAANSYEKSEDYQNAIKYFSRIDNKQKMAQCCLKLKLYQQAIKIYEKINNIQKLVQCYVSGQKWVELFQLLLKNKDKKIEKIKGKNIADNCINKVLHSYIDNAKINEQKKTYLYFYGLKMEQNKSKKLKYNSTQFSNQISSMTNQNNYWNYKQIFDKMVSIKQLYDYYHKLFKQKQIQFQQIKQEIINTQDRIASIQQNLKIQMTKLQNILKHEQFNKAIFTEDQQKMDQSQFQINAQNYCIIKNRIQLSKQFRQKTDHLNALIKISASQQKKLHLIEDQIRQIQRVHDIKKLADSQRKLALELKNIINNHFEDLKITKVNQQNSNNSMIGIHLFPPQKLQIIKQIEQVIKISEQITQYSIQSQYEEAHHRYIEQKIHRQLAQSYNQLDVLRLLKRCDSVGQNMCCLLICDYYKELIALAPRYIMNFTLQLSSNYKYNRFIKNNEDASQEQSIELVQNFMINIDNQTLSHKIPQMGLRNHYYYISMANNIVSGLILQGYFKIALLFCQKGVSCQLAYLFSSYELLIQQIRKIATSNNIRNLPDKTFLFITDPLILKNVPESKAVNIFSIQNIFYAYDQCQEEPFLSKKQTADDINVQETEIIQIFDNKVQQRQQQLKIYQNYLQRSIEQKLNLIKTYKRSMEQNEINQKTCFLIFKNEIDILCQEKQHYLNERDNKRQQIYEVQTQHAQAIKKQIDCKLNKKQKQKYEQDICAYLLSRPKRQDNNVETSQIQNQYKEKLRLQSQSHQEFIKIQIQLRLVKKQQQYLTSEIYRITGQINNFEKMIKGLKPEDMKRRFQDQINKLELSIVQDRNNMPKQLLIIDEQQRRQSLQKLLIKQHKQAKYKQRRQKKIQQTMRQISKNSNIPSSNYFLRYYLQGQLKFGNQNRSIPYDKIDEIYMNILQDGNDIDNLEQNDTNNETICNIIIFYLSYLFRKSFREDITAFIGRYYFHYQQNYENILYLQKQIQTNAHQIQFCIFKLSQLGQQKIKERSYYLDLKKKAQIKRNSLGVAKSQQGIFQSQPKALLQSFLDKMFERIKKVDKKHNKFMEILFGFFQCRIIKDCPPLSYLSNQYLLARSSSVVIEELKRLVTLKFCYYFDHQKTTVLCHFTDIQKIILNRIETKHKQIFEIRVQLNKKQIKNANAQKYLDKEVLGYLTKPDNLKNRQYLNYHILSTPNQERKKIQKLYEEYLSSKMTSKIKMMKRSLLQFYFENEFVEKQSFHFVLHQINECQFLQQMYIQMEKFNANQLMQMQKKFEGLEIEHKRWISNAIKTQGKLK